MIDKIPIKMVRELNCIKIKNPATNWKNKKNKAALEDILLEANGRSFVLSTLESYFWSKKSFQVQPAPLIIIEPIIKNIIYSISKDLLEKKVAAR